MEIIKKEKYMKKILAFILPMSLLIGCVETETPSSSSIADACSTINLSKGLGYEENVYITKFKNDIKFQYKKLSHPFKETQESYSSAGNDFLLVSYISQQDEVIIQVNVKAIPSNMRKEVENLLNAESSINSLVNSITQFGELIEYRMVLVNNRKFLEIEWFNLDVFGKRQRTISWISFVNGSMINITGTAFPDNFSEHLNIFKEFNCSISIETTK